MMLDGTTPLIITGHELEGWPDPIWPVNFFDLNRYYPYIGFQDKQPEEAVASLHIYPIHPGVKPDNEVVEAAEPILVEGVGYVQQYTGRDYTPEEAAEALKTGRENRLWRLDNCLQNTYDAGWSHTTNGVSYKYSMTSDNRQLIQTMYSLAQLEVNANRQFRARTFDDQVILLERDQLVEMAVAMAEYSIDILDQLWDILDHINLATKVSELPMVPDNLLPSA